MLTVLCLYTSQFMSLLSENVCQCMGPLSVYGSVGLSVIVCQFMSCFFFGCL